jgi:hypothetical protein
LGCALAFVDASTTIIRIEPKLLNGPTIHPTKVPKIKVGLGDVYTVRMLTGLHLTLSRLRRCNSGLMCFGSIVEEMPVLLNNDTGLHTKRENNFSMSQALLPAVCKNAFVLENVVSNFAINWFCDCGEGVVATHKISGDHAVLFYEVKNHTADSWIRMCNPAAILMTVFIGIAIVSSFINVTTFD